jgi:hypothetical protein
MNTAQNIILTQKHLSMSIENNFLEEEIKDMCNDIDYDLMEYEYHNYQPKENINQINYKMKKVENNTTKKENVETVKETRKEALRRLFKDNGLVEEDVYKDKRGFVIITRTGIDKIVSKNNITVAYEVISMDIEKGYCVLKALASMTINGEQRNMMSFGESADNNLMGGGKKFPVAMAEKRAMSRVVLKIAGFYEQGVFGQDEIVD